MDSSPFGAAIGMVIGLPIALWIIGRRNRQLAPLIAPALEARGPLTLPELQVAIDMNGFYKRGKVVMALAALVQEGKIEEIPAPPDTPMLERVNHIKYRWK